MASQPAIFNVHTPATSFSIIHSLTQDTLESLYDKLSRKVRDYHGARVGPGWLKYEHNDSIWNLDDDSDYTIFTWRQQQLPTSEGTSTSSPNLSSSTVSSPSRLSNTPTVHLHNPTDPLPSPPAYMNPLYYAFRPSRAAHPHNRSVSSSPKPRSTKSRMSKRTTKTGGHPLAEDDEDDGIPKHKKQFEKFHSENGVRTVIGSIGPVQNVRMLLKSGYRHVYISRKFAIKHGFIPADAAPGHYGYGGLVNIGTWPITLTPSKSSNDTTNPHRASSPSAAPQPNGMSPSASVNGAGSMRKKKKGHLNGVDSGNGPKPTMVAVYLSEEPHFDVVLGRSFFEKRQIRTTATDLTDVVCLDTGEKIECELVILKDGRGEIVTVT